ncbi:MAG TPA: fumarylacetoacetate hydrolase family protein [Patescibacteria group bacterium]|nr:fumarylacetoacetate hydrolase family protein [Patescibacteria group bacterium]
MRDDDRNIPSYRLVTYETPRGPRAGLLLGEAVFDLAELTGKVSYATMLGVLGEWEAAEPLVETAARQAESGKTQGTPLAQVKLLAPVLYPSAIYCAGANYSDHTQEMARARNLPPAPDPHDLGLAPWHFIKASRSVVEAEAAIALPAHSQKVDWEGELAAFVGRAAKNVSLENALDYIAGYTIANDLSARDLTLREQVPESSPFRYDWVGQKSFDGACPVGPWIVPAREIPDPQSLGIRLWVNDELKQDSHTSKMIFTLAEQVAHLSTRITLHPGDLILTGTPAGVGLGRNQFLKSGDEVRVWIERIGTLRNTLV